MVEPAEAGFVLVSGLLAWLAVVQFTDGWGEPVILFWGALVTLGVAVAFLVADAVELPV